MTDAPPPSIPPSIPPRKRPASGAATRTVTTVPGRGGARPDGSRADGPGRAGAPPRQAQEPRPAGASHPAPEARPAPPAAQDVRPAPEARAPQGPPRAQEARPTDRAQARPTPAPEPAERSIPAPPAAPFPPADVPGDADDELPEGPTPLETAVEQTGQWLKKAASVAGASMAAAYSSLTRPRPKDDPMPVNPGASALPRTVPPTAPATTGPAPTVRPASGRTPAVGPGPRRLRLAISRVDPWSVMKLAFLLSFAGGIVLVVAVSVLWLTLDGLHVFTSINSLVSQIVGNESSVNVLDYLKFSKVLSVATLVAVVDVFLLTALATIGTFLYNVVAALVGGMHVTMTDE